MGKNLEKFKNSLERFREMLRTKIKIKKIKIPSLKSLFAFILKWWHFSLAILFAVLVLYFPVGALLSHHIDLSLDFKEQTFENKVQAQSLKTLSALIDREVNQTTFTPNLPVIFPSSLLDNMPAFQTGVIHGLRKSVQTLEFVNPKNASLKEAEELLSSPVDIWHIKNWKPVTSSPKKYNKAGVLLSEYHEQIQDAPELFNTSEIALEVMLLSISNSLQEQVISLEKSVEVGKEKLIDLSSDEAFYQAKGNAYVLYLLLRDLKFDYPNAFANEGLENKRLKALSYLEKALLLSPLVISNGAPETQFMPNHLLSLAFYLSQASLSLLNVSEILL